jgi:5'-deoxynucleotidase YfbR-like HD superfamily hydrolase
MSPELRDLVHFLEFINKFKLIKRTVLVAGEKPRRAENDAEHSYELTITAWYLIDSLKLKLDLNKVLKYCLVHDLVEVYAGDIDPFMYPNTEITKLKAENEENALKKISLEFPEFAELSEWIKEYEKKADEESVFVYVLDKVIADFGWNFVYKGTLKECGISEATMLKRRDEKISKYPMFLKYYNEALDIWRLEPEQFAEVDFVPPWKNELLGQT